MTQAKASVPTLKIETPRAFLPLLGQHRYKGAHGGRGSGKSHFFAELLIEECVADPTTRAVCVREIQKSLDQSVKQLIADKIVTLGAQAHFEVLDTEIHVRAPSGTRTGIITFQGMQNHTADSIKSLEGYRIAWVEEAQGLSQRSLDLLTPTLRVPGAQIWFSWNPKTKKDSVDVFMRSPDSAGDPEIACIEVNYSDNPWFHETSLAADMERDRRRDPEKYAHIWRGKYQVRTEAQVFKNWRSLPFETPKDAVFRFGGDFGFAVDPTVLIRCFIGRWKDDNPETGIPVADDSGRVLFIDHEAYKVGCEIDHTPALFAGSDTQDPPRWKNPFGHQGIPGSLIWPMVADSARPETISFLRRHGFSKITGAKKGPGSVEEGIEFLKSYDIVIHPRCINAVDEFTLYSFKTDKLTNEVLPVLEDKKNHVIDAARYAVEGVRRKAPVAMSMPMRG